VQRPRRATVHTPAQRTLPVLAFLDEDELAPGPPGSRRHRPDRQQILIRRLVALGAGILVIVLLLLAVRGCLNARKERGFENYLSDLDGIVANTDQLRDDFFSRLTDPPENLDATTLEAQIAADRGTAESLLQRVQGLDTPDELAGAQNDFVLAYELRRDALAGVSDNISAALGEQGRADALEQIASDMRSLLASDVLYARGQAEGEGVLAEEEIAGRIEDSQFLINPEFWLDDLAVSSTLSSVACDTGAAQGIHGLELVSTTVTPGNTVLIAGEENTVTRTGDEPELQVEVTNGGESEERDVIVQFELTGAGTQIDGETTISSIDPGGLETATIPLEGRPETETPLALEVTSLPVPCETLFDNNTANYTVTFER
jgi:hypothetical protein